MHPRSQRSPIGAVAEVAFEGAHHTRSTRRLRPSRRWTPVRRCVQTKHERVARKHDGKTSSFTHSDQLTSSVLKWARALLLCACSPRVGARRQPEPVPVSTAIWVTTSRSTSAVHGCTPPYYGIIVPPKCGFSNYNVFCEQGARSVERSARDARGGLEPEKKKALSAGHKGQRGGARGRNARALSRLALVGLSVSAGLATLDRETTRGVSGEP